MHAARLNLLENGKTSRAVISFIGRDPKDGKGEAHEPFELSSAWPPPSCPAASFPVNSAAIGRERIRASLRLALLGIALCLRRVFALAPRSCRAASRASRASFKPIAGIDAYRQCLLDTAEAIGDAPTFRAIRRDPQLKPATVRELDDFCAGESALDRQIGKGMLVSTLRWYRRHTNKCTNKSVGRKHTPSDSAGRSSGTKGLIFRRFWTNVDAFDRLNGAQERTRTFTACTAGT